MNRRLLALGLILCILLSGCTLFSGPEPDPPDPTVPEEPADDAPQDDPSPEPAPVEPLPLPTTGAIDWNDAPAQSVGEGGPAPESAVRPIYFYSAYDFCDYDAGEGIFSDLPDERGVILNVNDVEITGLRNLILQNRLNEFIDTRTQELIYAELSMTQSELTEIAVRNGGVRGCTERAIFINVMVSGRVLTLHFSFIDSIRIFDEQGGDIFIDENMVLAALEEYHTYDMYDGRQLRLRDLFHDGAEYAPVVDAAIAAEMRLAEDDYCLKRAFRGLPEDYPYFSADTGTLSIYFPEDNPYTETSAYFSLEPDELYEICSMLYEDPSAYLTDEVPVQRGAFSYSVPALVHTVDAVAATEDGDAVYSPRLHSGAPQAVLDSVNAAIDGFETRFAALDYLPAGVADAFQTADWHDFYVYYKLIGGVLCLSYDTEMSDGGYYTCYTEYLSFDLRDGRQLTAADLLIPSEELDSLLAGYGITDPLDLITSVSIGYGFDVLIGTRDLDEQVVVVPAEHFNFTLIEREGLQ